MTNYDRSAHSPDAHPVITALEALPVTSPVDPVSKKAALAAFLDLRQHHPQLYKSIRLQIAAAQNSLARELEEHSNGEYYVLTLSQLKAAIAQSAIAGAIITAYSTGQALDEIGQLNLLATTGWPDKSNGEYPDQPPETA